MDLDVTSLLEAALQQGIWAALYIYLFFRMLKENASREERYQNMIDRLSSNIENGIDTTLFLNVFKKARKCVIMETVMKNEAFSNNRSGI